jgi:hypothetical protein
MASDSMFNQAKAWLDECQNQHQFYSSQRTPELPTRVIDVWPKIPKLHISMNGERAYYTALSYCWGGPQQASTTTATIQGNICGLPMDTLPQSIQDAIKVTRKLRFRYLWIDAFCIIQNDASDKSMEITKMGAIYKNASLTIAAKNSSSVRDGFLLPKDPDQAFYLPFLLPDGRVGHVTLMDTPMYHSDSANRGWPYREPLDTRGWALQEILLSRRVLIYSKGEVKWQCRKCGPAGPATLSIPRLPKHREIRDAIRARDNQWEQIVEEYSRRQLSLSEDRLPAIAAIAAEIGKIIKDRYLAGMWERSLISQLGWKCTEKAPRSEDTYLAPSWSWASANRAVRFLPLGEPFYISGAKLLHCIVKPANPDAPLAQVLYGRLVLRTLVHRRSTVRADILKALDEAVTMDYSREEIDEDSCYMKLNYGFGLVIKPCEDEECNRVDIFKKIGIFSVPVRADIFKRIGIFSMPAYEAKFLWKRANSKVVIII